ncbi:MAG: hypothetical protein AVDCRST_MAG05-4672, partial [uncultured Rubrobacteraceae bacterium]
GRRRRPRLDLYRGRLPRRGRQEAARPRPGPGDEGRAGRFGRGRRLREV